MYAKRDAVSYSMLFQVSISMHERTTVSARWVAPKADLSHVIVDDLKTPLGKFPCAVLRMGDIVAVRCPWQAIAPGQQPPSSPQAGSTMMERPG